MVNDAEAKDELIEELERRQLLREWAIEVQCLVDHGNDACGAADMRLCCMGEIAYEVLDALTAAQAERDALRALLQLETWDDGTWLVSVVDQRIARALLAEQEPV